MPLERNGARRLALLWLRGDVFRRFGGRHRWRLRGELVGLLVGDGGFGSYVGRPGRRRVFVLLLCALELRRVDHFIFVFFALGGRRLDRFTFPSFGFFRPLVLGELFFAGRLRVAISRFV
jgi:hypothetical protein